MKISVSLPDEDIALVDRIANEAGTSRSSVLHQAVTALRHRDLPSEYAAAYDEWDSDGHAADWDAVAADGLTQ